MYKRVLLNLSGEALSGNEKNFGPAILKNLAKEIKEAQKSGVQIAIVVGGGNFIRGKTVADIGIDRVQGDYMGMLATIINALAIQSALEGVGVDTRPLKWKRLLNRSFSVVPSDIWKRAESLSSVVVPVLRISQQIPQRHYVQVKSRPMSFSWQRMG